MSDELSDRLREHFRLVDNLLVNHHGLRNSLKAGHPPLNAPDTMAVDHYGPGVLLNLWRECAAVDAICRNWTGKPFPSGDVSTLQVPVPPVAAEPDATTDESPGLTVEAPPSVDVDADRQPRLGVAEA